MIWVYAFLLVFLAAFDAKFTAEILSKCGPEVELNTAIRYMAPIIGIKAATLIGVLGPTAAIAALGLGFHLTGLILFLLGARTNLFAFQLYRRNHAPLR